MPDDVASSPEPQTVRKVSRRGVLAGLAAVPLVLGGAGAASAKSVAAPEPAGQARVASQSSGRIVHSTAPPLEESDLSLIEGLTTPTGLHFIRNHMATPEIDLAAWRLVVDGEVDQPLELSYDDLRRLPSQSLNILIECAGNGRGRFSPPAQGTQWGYGAASVAEWTGVRLRTVLELAGMRGNVVHVVARGGDSIGLTRGLPTEHALRPDTMLAWAMNGETLPVAHGFPLRLVVPGWIGVANVKWVTHITASPTPHEGQHQTVNYVVYREDQPPFQATLQPVRSVIARPTPGSTLGGSPLLISGFAWSGNGRISAVDVSTDGGQSWTRAELFEPVEARHWARWGLAWQPPAAGNYSLMSRATDETGASQPFTVEWNRLGYGYNAVEAVPITIGEAPAAVLAPPVESAEQPELAETEPPLVLSEAAVQGQHVYNTNCASCHGATGEGSVHGPLLVGDNSAVRSMSRADLIRFIKTTMPYNAPGSLTDLEYEQVAEFLRAANGLP